MKKILYILIITLSISACNSISGRSRTIKAPNSAKRGDSYIFLERVEHKQNKDYIIKNEKNNYRFILKVKGNDIEKVNIVINEEKNEMDLIGEISDYEYYKCEKIILKDSQYYFELLDGKAMNYMGEEAVKDFEKLKKLKLLIRDEESKNEESWNENIVVYDIFLDRFRNGNLENDPIFSEFGAEYHDKNRETLESGTPKSYLIPSNHWAVKKDEKSLGEFKISGWGSDWRKKEEWEKKLEENYNKKSEYYRFYGGDIQGLIEKLDYIKEKGFTAINLSPVFYSNSNHRYDTSDYRHISPNLAFIEQIAYEYDYEINEKIYSEEGESEYKFLERLKDNKTIENEDISNYIWTESDLLFASLIKEAHKREIRVIVEMNLASSSNEFWAFKKALEDGPKSEYKDWYIFTDWEKVKEYKKSNEDVWNPLLEYNGESKIEVIVKKGKRYRRKWLETKQDYSANEKNEISLWNKENVAYEAESGFRELVLFNYKNTDLRKHIVEAAKKWVQGPDGKVSELWEEDDGVDAYMVDFTKFKIEEEFFKELRQSLVDVKKDFKIGIDIFLEAYKESDNLDYDMFKNYQLGGYINNYVLGIGKYKLTEEDFRSESNLLRFRNSNENYRNSYTYLSSKDSDRLFSMIINKGRELDLENEVQDLTYLTIRPDYQKEDFIFELKLMTVLQMTQIGVPVVYYGDEIGMWGADDPNNRKPMIWEDITYEKESDDLKKYKNIKKVFGEELETDEANSEIRYSVEKNEDIENWYKEIIGLRNKYKKIFVYGKLEYMMLDNNKNIIIYQREFEGERILVMINKSSKAQEIILELDEKGRYDSIFDDDKYNIIDRKLKLELKEKTIKILYAKKG